MSSHKRNIRNGDVVRYTGVKSGMPEFGEVITINDDDLAMVQWRTVGVRWTTEPVSSLRVECRREDKWPNNPNSKF